MGELVPQRPPRYPAKIHGPDNSKLSQPPKLVQQPIENKSILRQVDKYGFNDNLEPLVLSDDPYDVVKKSSPSREQWTDQLYPYSLLQAYHSVRVIGNYVSELYCDKLLTDFIAVQDKSKYLHLFKTSITDRIFRIVMSRVLVGTFFADSNGSQLPLEFRSIASTLLNIDENVSQDMAMRRLEEFNAMASHEEMILGRIGYLMIWQSGLRPADLTPPNYRLHG